MTNYVNIYIKSRHGLQSRIKSENVITEWEKNIFSLKYRIQINAFQIEDSKPENAFTWINYYNFSFVKKTTITFQSSIMITSNFTL